MTSFATRVVPRGVALRVRASRPLAQLARAAVNAVVGSEPQLVTIARGPLAGARMQLDLKREKGFWAGTFEPWVQDALLDWLPGGGCGWDVGAYVGYHTLLLHRLAGPERVVAVEPDPAVRERLMTNLALNHATGVSVVGAAAAAEDGELALQRHRHPIQNSLRKAGAHGTVPVATVRLDSLLTDHPAPTVVKMDIEGGEAAALAGAPLLLHEVRPVWIVELHWELGLAALDEFARAGYVCRPLVREDDVRAELERGGTRHVLAEPR